jgi:hypothetical protein
VLTKSVSHIDTSSCPTRAPWGSLHHHLSCTHGPQHINDLPNQVAIHHLLMGNLARSINTYNDHHPFDIGTHRARPIWAPSADFAASRQRYLEERRREKIRREKRLKIGILKAQTLFLSIIRKEFHLLIVIVLSGIPPDIFHVLYPSSATSTNRKQWLPTPIEAHQLLREEPVKTFDKQFQEAYIHQLQVTKHLPDPLHSEVHIYFLLK